MFRHLEAISHVRGTLPARSRLEFLRETMLKAIAQLRIDTRINLVRQVPAVEELIHINDVIVSLDSSDVDTADALLDRADLDDVHWLASRDGPNELWMQRALSALGRGWQPERVNTHLVQSGQVSPLSRNCPP